MARRIRDKNLESRDGRSKLKPRGKPYWKAIGHGLHLGYRKGQRTAVWVVRHYLGDQNYQTESIALADDTLDANGTDILDFWEAQERARGMRPGPRRGAYTVREAVSDYLSHLEGRASHYDVTKRLQAFALPAFGDRPVASLGADELRKWHRAIAKQGARAHTRPGAPQNYRKTDGDPEAARRRQSSANRCLGHLKAALNYAWHEGKTGLGEWPRVKPFKGVDLPRARYLTVAECQRLINAAQGDFRVLVQAALQTGARYQELARLRVSDFNRDAGTLHIRKSKANKDRHIFLTEEGMQFFAGLAVGRPALLLGREWRPGQQQRPMLVACKHASIDPPINFHQLRHTWASLSVMAGAPLMVVAKNLGHCDTRMVDRCYGHLAPSFVADAIRAAAPRFGIKPSNVRAL
jgi:integrase